MLGYEVDETDLHGLARKLTAGATDIEDTADAPPAPQAGPLTGLIAGHLGNVAGGMASVSEFASAAGQNVTRSASTYTNVDKGNADAFKP
ncbi:hypothetical protein EV193_102754 [Herbihabitans rhizosphaerae]|uniref:Uncharacterized protein n=1 Tax=Herbihabitans rhizosphaerae TaxID=1872711 RepID=A0A4V2EU93_9PSEU|nr:hypothetical protein [Herbihabitans rhizosphaerae]RZS43773.1 hypothetical protein EV193_102754 [Herbihabitans rhizosphaerae]